ncbi:MAG: hypothetical protein ABI812_04910 [Betaproteobacteria bacterium]
MPMRTPTPPKPKAPPNPWHAVSVQGGDSACDAARRMRGVRFLAAEAPRIPLAQCASPARCKCIYRHHADRRANLRRIADRGMYGRPAPVERRAPRDRRRVGD